HGVPGERGPRGARARGHAVPDLLRSRHRHRLRHGRAHRERRCGSAGSVLLDQERDPGVRLRCIGGALRPGPQLLHDHPGGGRRAGLPRAHLHRDRGRPAAGPQPARLCPAPALRRGRPAPLGHPRPRHPPRADRSRDPRPVRREGMSDTALRPNLKNPAFWNFGGLFFFYFAIWQLAFTFLSRWLEVEAGMSHGNIGLLNSDMALTAFCLQPVYGSIQDKLGVRKHLFAFVVLVGALMGPFFAFVFTPLVALNQVLGAVVGGLFLSLTLNAGVGIVEAFNERNSRANGFEYGHVRLFGSIAGAIASLVGGFIWASNPDNVWWAGTFSAIVLGVLLLVARTPKPGDAGYEAVAADAGETGTGSGRPKVDKQVVLGLLRNRSFLGFMVLMF